MKCKENLTSKTWKKQNKLNPNTHSPINKQTKTASNVCRNIKKVMVHSYRTYFSDFFLFENFNWRERKTNKKNLDPEKILKKKIFLSSKPGNYQTKNKLPLFFFFRLEIQSWLTDQLFWTKNKQQNKTKQNWKQST